ncbi:hypothetical protein VTO73DRAFT_4190 [Trametes versicolor]
MDLNSPSILRAQLTGLLLEGILFGCFAILYPISLWILLYKHGWRGYSRLGMMLFSIVTIMFVLALTHLVLLAETIIEDFADHSTDANGPLFFLLTGRGRGTTVASIVIHAVVSWIGEIFMAYRVFIVWGRSWKAIVLPCSLLAGTGVTIGFCVHAFKNSHLDVTEALYADNVSAFMTTYLALVLAMNIITLALILGRLMQHDRIIRNYRADSPGPTIPWRVARTIVQSEAVYSATILANLVLYVIRSTGFFVTAYMLPPLVGISFTLIITHSGFDEIVGQLKQANDVGHDLDWVVNRSLKESRPTSSVVPSSLAVTASASCDKVHRGL